MAKLYTDIELWDPARLTPYRRNTKRHPQVQIDRLAGQIAAHGFDQPIVVDRQGVIVKGHGRRQAAMQLGLSQVPVVMTEMTDEQACAARIADNQLVSLEYDTRHMEEELGRLRESQVDLSLTGMDNAQIDQLLAGEGLRARDDAARDAHAQEPAGRDERDLSDGGERMDDLGAGGGSLASDRIVYVQVGAQKIPATVEELEHIIERLTDYESAHGTSLGFWSSLLR